MFREIVQFNPEKLQAGGGSGFGLFLAKGIIDLHDGNISVYSEGEGSGSTFRIEIPMTKSTCPVEVKCDSCILTTKNIISNNTSSEVYDFLVVDDSPMNRKLLCKLFRAAGHICSEQVMD